MSMLPSVSTSSLAASSRTERECLRAAGLIGLGAAVVAVIAWAGSFPGWPVVAGVALSILVLAGLMLIVGAPPPPSASWLRPVGLVAALVVAIGGGVLVERSSQAVLLARFERSRPAFEAIVATADRVPAEVTDRWVPFTGACPDRVGSYRISQCHEFDGGFVYLQQRTALGGDAGFAYLPYGPRAADDGATGLPGMPDSSFTHLLGPWYAWTCNC